MVLLQAPQVRQTEVFTRLPDRFRRSGVRSSWVDANRGGQAIDSFLEGPVFDRVGNLYVCDIPFGRIFPIDPRGDWLAVDEAGRVIVANPGLGLAWVLGPLAEPVQVLKSCTGASLTNLAFGGPSRRTIYATESATGSVLRAELDHAGLALHRAASRPE